MSEESFRLRDSSGESPTRAAHSALLLGNEAVGRAAVDAGISAAYSYPGTPATEVLESILSLVSRRSSSVVGRWCANEKTAYERALGVSFSGRRTLVSMKHVGLNVAADPFINSALVPIRGGLVLAVADDPGMHSSQNEQDSRLYAEFAKVLCLEPSTPQQAYDMTREAFDLSERLRSPVVVRLVTNLSHSRSAVRFEEAREPVELDSDDSWENWVLLPRNARRYWQNLLDKQPRLERYSASSAHNELCLSEHDSGFGVVTAGIGRTYFEEYLGNLNPPPSYLHVGVYPPPADQLRYLGRRCSRILFLEEGAPLLEKRAREIMGEGTRLTGKLSGHLTPFGELNPEAVASALGLGNGVSARKPDLTLPIRPPRLCDGCPHKDTFQALREALGHHPDCQVMTDIGCYTLGALPPYEVGASCVCMGSSLGMAKGLADSGVSPAVAVIGDSTFVHSGIPSLIEAVVEDLPLTLLILDNQAVAMTGGQAPLLSTEQLETLLLGLGVSPKHLVKVSPHPRRTDDFARAISTELEYRGLSVMLVSRECVQNARRKK